MSRTLKRLQSLGAKAGAFALSGVLALSMTPAIALANDELTASASDALTVADATQVATSSYANTIAGGTKNIIGKNGDALNGTVQPVTSGTDENNHTYQYMGYAHSDNGGHYQAYSLYTQLKTDDNGILTSIDLTSGNDTFAGKWGYQQAKVPSEGSTKKGGQTSKVVPIEGFLPVGVEFVVTKDGGIYTAKLTGANQMGYTIYQVEYIPVTAAENDGSTTYSVGASKKAITATTTGERGNKTTTYTWGEDLTIGSTASGTTDDSTLTGDLTIDIPNADGSVVYNLVKCTYIIGSEQTAFNVYFCADDVAKQYVDQKITATSWTDDPVQAESNGVNYTTNRDGWTAIMGSVMMRELASWGAAMANPSLSTDLDGELGGIDTVSGATKTSVPFVEALVAAQKAGYIKGVSEDLKFTIDGAHETNANSLPRLTVSNASESQDQTTITTSEDGTYTANVKFKPNGGGRVSLDAIYLYDLHDKTVGTQGMMVLAKQTTPEEDSESVDEKPYQVLRSYTPTAGDSFIPYSVILDDYQSTDYTNEETGVKTNNVDTLTNNDLGFEYKSAGDAHVTVKNKTATHLVMEYTVGHGTIAIAYDLENMVNAGNVTAQINDLGESPSSDNLAKVRASYNALPYDVRPFVTNFSTLKTAENNAGTDYAEAVKDAETALKNAHTIGDFTIAPGSYTYSGAAIKPAVTAVKAVDGTEVDPTHYTVSYSNNTNAGTKATVTVKGTGVGWSGEVSKTFTIAPAASSIKLADQTLTYTVSALAYSGAVTKSGSTGKVAYSYFSDAACTKAVSAANVKNAGTYYVKATVAAAGNYAAATSNVAKLTVGKASQTIKAAKTYSVKKKQVKKKARKIAVKFKATGGGKITYSSAKSGKVSIAKNGKVTVKKGAAKKTYTLKVKVTAAESGNYAKTTQTVKLKVKVK